MKRARARHHHAQPEEETLMSQIRVIVVSPEEAYDGTAEFWCGGELRIDSRPDGQPWLIDTATLAHGLDEANRLIAAY
jgi:hypothetical protein